MQVILRLSKDLPLVVEYRIQDMGHLRCALQPRTAFSACPNNGRAIILWQVLVGMDCLISHCWRVHNCIFET
jgi:hypothetical protein